MVPRPPRSTLFPSTPLFRSANLHHPNSTNYSASDHLPIHRTPFTVRDTRPCKVSFARPDRKSTRLNSSHDNISYAVFCLKKKNLHLYARATYGLAQLAPIVK